MGRPYAGPFTSLSDQRGDRRRLSLPHRPEPARVGRRPGCSCSPRWSCTPCSSCSRSSRPLDYSLYDWNGLEPLDQFVGLANFERALSDPVFLGAVSHNAFIVILSLVDPDPVRARPRADAEPPVPRTRDPAPDLLRPVRHRRGHHGAIVWSLLLQPNGLAEHAPDQRSASGRPTNRGWRTPTRSSSPCSSSSRGSTSGST